MKFKKIICLLISFSILILFSACVMPKNNKQTKVLDTKWQSEENDYGIDLNFTAFKEGGVLFGQISYKGKTEEIYIVWGNLRFVTQKVSFYGNTIDTCYASGYYKIIK